MELCLSVQKVGWVDGGGPDGRPGAKRFILSRARESESMFWARDPREVFGMFQTSLSQKREPKRSRIHVTLQPENMTHVEFCF